MDEEVIYTEGNKSVILTRNHFDNVKNITFKDVKRHIKFEHQLKTLKVIDNGVNDSSYVCHLTENYPKSIQAAYDEVHNNGSWLRMHIYSTFSYKGNTFGRHKDTSDVLIVQSKGRMMYKFDNKRICILNPGDSLKIPIGVYHEPFVIEPRVTLSFDK